MMQYLKIVLIAKVNKIRKESSQSRTASCCTIWSCQRSASKSLKQAIVMMNLTLSTTMNRPWRYSKYRRRSIGSTGQKASTWINYLQSEKSKTLKNHRKLTFGRNPLCWCQRASKPPIRQNLQRKKPCTWTISMMIVIGGLRTIWISHSCPVFSKT